MFPWKTDPEIQKVPWASIDDPRMDKYRERFPGFEYGPDLWACEFLDDLGAEIRERKFDGKNAVRPIRFSTASGHGIGKSTMTGWLVMFILDTRPMSKLVVTANTGEQLRTKTWASVAMWHSKAASAPLWEITTGRGAMSLYRKGDGKPKEERKHINANWRADGLTCRAENSESFQGLHAAGGTACFIFDEASGIDDIIFEARSGAATDGEPMWFDWGNPTRKSGYFYENTVGQYRHRFNTRSVNSMDCYIAGGKDKELFKEWIDDYGIDSDFVKVKVLGQFPSAGSLQFISTSEAEMAMNRPVVLTPRAPAVIGVDVARFGDNSTVIYPRVGDDARTYRYTQLRGLDGYQVAEAVIGVVKELRNLGHPVEGIFVDGGGLGSSPVDFLRKLGYNPIDCQFGARSGDSKYARKGDEIWANMREAIRNRLALPFNLDIKRQLTQREYGFNTMTNRIKLETKESMRTRGAESPDVVDALALTFYSDVAAFVGGELSSKPQMVISEFDPYASAADAASSPRNIKTLFRGR
jgi:hypothetical protein